VTAPARRRPRQQVPAAPAPTFTQDELRQRRRRWLRVTYEGRFDLAAEVSAVIGPMAAPLSALPRPAALRADVDAVADAVAELLHAVVGMLAESKRLDRAAKARTATAVADLAQRPPQPPITDKRLADGSWTTLLVSTVAPYAGDFAAFLGRAAPSNHPQLIRAGHASASERLEAALRVLDLAALDLQRRIPKVAAYQALPSVEEVNTANRARRDAERMHAVLAKMGIEETP
jgi:hypothetical protein